MTAPSGYSPARPPNERDVVQTISGQPNFLGVLLSTSAASVNNATTAIPFNTPSTAPGYGLKGSLAGKVLLLQPNAAGYILPGEDATVTIVAQGTAPVLVPPASIPGVYIGNQERVEITMGPTTPYLQWKSASGTGSLFVWEMT